MLCHFGILICKHIRDIRDNNSLLLFVDVYICRVNNYIITTSILTVY